MFAEQLEWDVTKRNDLVIPSGFVEGTLQHRFRVFAVTFEPFLVCAGDPRRGIFESLPPGVVAGPSQKRPNCFFDLTLRWLELVDLGHDDKSCLNNPPAGAA